MKRALTRTERFLLNEVDSCPDKTASRWGLQYAAGLTPVGFRRTIVRMVSDNLLGWTENSQITLTFGGIQAMRAASMEVAA